MPTTMAQATYVTSTCDKMGMTRPSEAKNQTRGKRPRNVAKRYFRLG